jgi:predicted Zn-dependent peptidase
MLGECKRQVLSNGLRVLGVQNPALHSFVCSVYIGGGALFETQDQAGLSHFVEHMILQGSEHFPTSRVLMRSVEELGGIVDAGTYAEYINVFCLAHRKHWPRAMEIASDVLLRPLFTPDEIEQEKRIIAQEISPHRDRAGRNISPMELTHCIAFRGQVWESGTRGSRATLQRFDKLTVERRYRQFFTPGNMVVCLAGGLDFEEVLGKVEKSFGCLTAGEPAPAAPAAPVPGPAGRARAFYRPTEALPVAEAVLCFYAYPLAHERFDACRAVNHLLGAGLSSRLFTRVREELGLVYDVQSHLQGYAAAGMLEVFLSVSVENLVDAVRATLEVIRQAAADGFTAAELERYKETARCGMDMLCDSAASLADWFGRHELILGPDGAFTPRYYVRRQEALTLEGVNAVARELMADSGATFVVVGPYGDAEADALRRLLPAEELSPSPEPNG